MHLVLYRKVEDATLLVLYALSGKRNSDLSGHPSIKDQIVRGISGGQNLVSVVIVRHFRRRADYNSCRA